MEPKPPWQVIESGQRLTVLHEHRWLGWIGWPMVAAGVGGAAVIWLLPFDGDTAAWPFQAVGSLIGGAFVLMGLELSLGRETITADKVSDEVVRREGFGPFTRIRRQPLRELEAVVCEPETLRHPGGSGRGSGSVMLLTWPGQVVRVARGVQPEPILAEAERWAAFLGPPLINRLVHTRADRLRGRMDERRSQAPNS